MNNCFLMISSRLTLQPWVANISSNPRLGLYVRCISYTAGTVVWNTQKRISITKDFHQKSFFWSAGYSTTQLVTEINYRKL